MTESENIGILTTKYENIEKSLNMIMRQLEELKTINTKIALVERTAEQGHVRLDGIKNVLKERHAVCSSNSEQVERRITKIEIDINTLKTKITTKASTLSSVMSFISFLIMVIMFILNMKK